MLSEKQECFAPRGFDLVMQNFNARSVERPENKELAMMLHFTQYSIAQLTQFFLGS
jgi:hypothetical protein